MSDQKTNPKAPLETLRDGALKTSLFRNQSKNGEFISIVPGRIYTDGKGNIQETKSLSGPEALRMANLLTQAYGRSLALKNTLQQPERSKASEREL